MPRRTGEVRASSTMIPSHAALISHPGIPPQATVHPDQTGLFDVEYVLDKKGNRHYLGLGCQHMSAGAGASTSGLCHIPGCRVNERASRRSEAAQTDEEASADASH